jgi:hypothetical protein
VFQSLDQILPDVDTDLRQILLTSERVQHSLRNVCKVKEFDINGQIVVNYCYDSEKLLERLTQKFKLLRSHLATKYVELNKAQILKRQE